MLSLVLRVLISPQQRNLILSLDAYTVIFVFTSISYQKYSEMQVHLTVAASFRTNKRESLSVHEFRQDQI